MSRFHNALYAGDVHGRIAVLREVGLRELSMLPPYRRSDSIIGADPLAYLTAKTNELEELAEEILESAGLTPSDIDDIPSFGTSTLSPPPVITDTTDLNWPSVSTGESFFDRALANGKLEGGADVPYVNGYDVAGVTASSALDAWAKEEETQDEIDPEEVGWELDAEDAYPQTAPLGASEAGAAAEIEDLGPGATPGFSEMELWVRNSPFAADHAAAGSFETAMQVSSASDDEKYLI